MNIKASIEKTKSSFEKSFTEKTFYERQTKDNSHLEFILNILNARDKESILDLGTGTGFLAFPIAERNKAANITGLDIVEDTLKRNRKSAEERGLENIRFISYEGVKFPVEDNSIDAVVTRYALHHFPCIEDTFFEIARVLKSGGRLLISDPTPNEDDEKRFVDDFMRLKPDGHIKFYTVQELSDIGEKAGLKFVSNETTKIRFPRKNTKECRQLLEENMQEILDSYEIEINDEEIFISERVLNSMFIKE